MKKCLPLMKIIGCMDERTVRTTNGSESHREIMPYAKLVCKEKLNLPVALNTDLDLNVESSSLKMLCIEPKRMVIQQSNMGFCFLRVGRS